MSAEKHAGEQSAGIRAPRREQRQQNDDVRTSSADCEKRIFPLDSMDTVKTINMKARAEAQTIGRKSFLSRQ
ncbi:MAG: hypothetical protein KH352_01760 [Ruminococcus sp.]|nr:hypothetical protein [Candidatus Apopatosoma intestinale]